MGNNLCIFSGVTEYLVTFLRSGEHNESDCHLQVKDIQFTMVRSTYRQGSSWHEQSVKNAQIAPKIEVMCISQRKTNLHSTNEII